MSFQFQGSNVLARLKPFGITFEKSLNDLIKGIRAHSKESPESLSLFLDNAIVECKDELNTTDLETKAIAILKLAYLEMYGFEMSWCNFHILEVMSSTKFQQKRIGYLAAIQSFKNEKDLLILATNQFKKDLNSHNHVEIGLALSGIATIVTPNLSKDINDDVLMKLSHSKPYIRKKAILAMYKIFLQYPDSLRINFNRVIEKLDDDDTSVVSATINVICEISKKNPRIFVNYLPQFFKILEDTKNNWLIIRILKLFQSLSKVEPRMKKKILPTIVSLMMKTKASSLIYECINCIISGAMLSPDSSSDRDTAKLCIEKIMEFFETKDSNLKFVGLLALINTVKVFPTLISKVKGVSEIIMECLTDDDLIIKSKALEICEYLINEDNIVDLVKILLVQLIPGEKYIPDNIKMEISMKILAIGSSDNYSNVPNFKWYLAVLKDMISLVLLPAKNETTNTAPLSPKTSKSISLTIGGEFKSLVTRIPSIRSNILKVVVELVSDIKVLDNCPLLLKDFYWILGEYIDDIKVSDEEDDQEEEDDGFYSYHQALKALSMGKKIEIINNLINNHIDNGLGLSNENRIFKVSSSLLTQKEPDVLVVLIPCLIKIYSSIVTDYTVCYGIDGKIPYDKYGDLAYLLSKLVSYLGNFESHPSYEVQERCLSWLEFLRIGSEAMDYDENKSKKLEQEEISFYKAEIERKVETISGSENSEESSEEEEDEESSEEEEEESEEEEGSNDYIDLSSEDGQEVSNEKEGIERETNQEEGEEKKGDEEEEEKEEEEAHLPRQVPMLLTHVLPSFFKSYELNPIAKNGQRSIPLPEGLDLSTQINYLSIEPLSEGEDEGDSDIELEEEVEQKHEQLIDLEELEHHKQERLERLKDDPYYISTTTEKPKSKSKFKKLIDLEDSKSPIESINSMESKPKKKKKTKLKKEKVLILSEETIGNSGVSMPDLDPVQVEKKKKKNLLKIDSSNLDNFDLNREIEVNDEDFGYDVDLEALRAKLTEAKLEPEKKKKKKKTVNGEKKDGEEKAEKPKKKKKKQEEATSTKHSKESSLQPESTDTKPNGVKESQKADSPTPISITKPKSKKKKTKAIIQE